MGQYHLTVNLDKKEFLMPHKLGVGLKLIEQTGFGNSTPDALFMLLAASNGYGSGDFKDNQNKVCGRWAGDRIAVMGDYAMSKDLPMIWDAEHIYHLCHDLMDCKSNECVADITSHFVDITDLVIPVMMENHPGLYIDMESTGWRKRHVPAEEWDVQP